jgi:hypothetical protein
MACRNEIFIKAGKIEIRAVGRIAVTAVIACLAVILFAWLVGSLTNLSELIPSFNKVMFHQTDAIDFSRFPQCAHQVARSCFRA